MSRGGKPMSKLVPLNADSQSTEYEPLMIGAASSYPRLGWDEDARLIAEAGEDTLMLGDFGNEGDDDLIW